MDLPTCINCQSKELTLKLVVNDYKIFKCKNCCLVKVYPNPTNEVLQKLYRGIDQNAAKGAVLREIRTFKEQPRHVIRNLKKMRIDPVIKYFPELNTSSLICDVGCGSGVYLAALQKIGFSNLYGIEFNLDSVKLINQEFKFKKVIQGEIKKSAEIPKVNLITAYDVLEHVPDPNSVFKEIYDMLMDNQGYIHIRVPNYRSLWAKMFRKKWLWMIPPYHLNYFDHRSLKDMAKRNGFHIIKITSRKSGFRIVFWFLQLRSLLTKKDIASFSSSSLTGFQFFLINWAECLFKLFYFPLFVVLHYIKADDCLELYAKKDTR